MSVLQTHMILLFYAELKAKQEKVQAVEKRTREEFRKKVCTYIYISTGSTCISSMCTDYETDLSLHGGWNKEEDEVFSDE